MHPQILALMAAVVSGAIDPAVLTAQRLEREAADLQQLIGESGALPGEAAVAHFFRRLPGALTVSLTTEIV